MTAHALEQEELAWESEAVINPAEQFPVERTLHEIHRLTYQGLPREAVTEARKVVDAVPVEPWIPERGLLDWGKEPDVAGEELRADAARRRREHQVSALGLWWARQTADRRQLGEPIWESIEVPVLLLGAPAVADAKVTWTSTSSTGVDHAFSVTVLGVGFGHDYTRTTTQQVVRECPAGFANRVVLHLPVRVSQWGFNYKGQDYVESTRVEVTEEGVPSQLSVRWQGVLSDIDAVRDLLGASGDIVDIVHGAQETGKITGEMKHETHWDLDLKPNIHGIEVGLKVSVKVTASSSNEVAYTLPAGHSYRSWSPAIGQGLGLIWLEQTA